MDITRLLDQSDITIGYYGRWYLPSCQGVHLSEGSLVRGFGYLENHNQRKQDKEYKQCKNSLPRGSVKDRTLPRG